MLPSVVHIVRRYGMCGGMEKYVWELTHHLLQFDLSVEVVCEEVFGVPDSRITVHTVDLAPPRPRWKSMLQFRDAVDAFIDTELQKRTMIIHSHERSKKHHITTFHGPPMNHRDKWLAWLPNKRIRTWNKMELEELEGRNVRCIVVVSENIKSELLKKYPQLNPMSFLVGYPGVGKFKPNQAIRESRTPQKRFIFVGKEWKRKGLDIALDIVIQLGRVQPVTLDIYGPCLDELPKAVVQCPLVRVVGWVDEIPWADYTALIHPARDEPFGMVVAEARQFGLPVLTSKNTGAVEMGFKGVYSCPVNSSTHKWLASLKDLLEDPLADEGEELWTWSDAARFHVDSIYPLCL